MGVDCCACTTTKEEENILLLEYNEEKIVKYTAITEIADIVVVKIDFKLLILLSITIFKM
jgi:hypothetical protein